MNRKSLAPGKNMMVLGAAFLLLSLQPLPAFSETFFDIYFGNARIADDTISATFQRVNILVPGQRFEASRRVSFDSADVYGLRLGHWFESYSWVGAAADLSYFEADGEGVDIDVVPLSLLLMFRYPLVASQAFPRGRLQPYAAFGPAFVGADFKLDFPEFSERVSSGGRGVGADFRAGLAWHLSRRLALFGEYRHLRADLKTRNNWQGFFALFGSVDLVEARADIRTSQVLGGLSFRF
jgi:hypothetical protein